MYAKLLKHEFKSQAGILSLLSAAALVAGLVGGGAMWYLANVFEQDRATIGVIFASLLLVGMIILVVAYSFAVIILLVYRFYKHHFSDEGYLTFTLPATTHQILLSSISNVVIWLVISGVVVFAAMMMILAPFDHLFKTLIGESIFGNLDEMWQIVRSEFHNGYFFLQVFSTVSSAVYGVMLPLISVSVGAQLVKKYKLLAGFAVYYGTNMLFSIIITILSIITQLGDFAAAYYTGEEFLVFSFLIPSLLQLGISIGGYFLMHYLADKKLNLQ